MTSPMQTWVHTISALEKVLCSKYRPDMRHLSPLPPPPICSAYWWSFHSDFMWRNLDVGKQKQRRNEKFVLLFFVCCRQGVETLSSWHTGCCFSSERSTNSIFKFELVERNDISLWVSSLDEINLDPAALTWSIFFSDTGTTKVLSQTK